MHFSSRREQRGDILVFTLLMLTVFVVIMAAWAQFTARQARALVDQEQEEQAFAISEAGLHRTLYVLNSGSRAPADLNGQTEVGVITDPTSGAETGRYEARYTWDGARLTVVSTGYDTSSPAECQQITGVIGQLSGNLAGQPYHLESFDHVTGATCAATLPGGPPPAPPGGTSMPAVCAGITITGQTIYGTNGDDVLAGTSRNDLIFGGRGNDTIDGRGGDDCLVGERGDDTISGGRGDDRLDGGQGNDNLRGDRGSDQADGGRGRDTCDAEVEIGCEN